MSNRVLLPNAKEMLIYSVRPEPVEGHGRRIKDLRKASTGSARTVRINQCFPKSRRQQTGAALLLILLIVLASGVYAFLNYNSATNANLERDRITTEALAQAKAALIGYASSRILGGAVRPGDLPCPDMNDNGSDSDEASSGGCGTPDKQLGRLPWKSLGIPDLRDGNGERLWYAVSDRFIRTPRSALLLNSDTPGTISLRDSNGALTLDATAGNGAIAVIIAPGAPLTRPTSVSNTTPYTQSRDAAGSLLPINYIDMAWGEDNADFAEISTNGLISGPVRDTNGNIVSNDRMLAITRQNLAPTMEKRVAGEVAICLTQYMDDNNNRLPWMANSSYIGQDLTLSGYLPDTGAGFAATVTTSASTMDTAWNTPCAIVSNSGWWPNWKALVTITIASYHKPQNSVVSLKCGIDAGASPCVTTSGGNKQFIVRVNGTIQSYNVVKGIP